MSFNKVSSNYSLADQGPCSDYIRTDSVVTTTAYQGLKPGFQYQGFVTEVHSAAFLTEGLGKKQLTCGSLRTRLDDDTTNREGFLKDSGRNKIPNGLPNEKVGDIKVKHWWESPAGKGSQGRAVTSTFPVHHAQANGSPADSPANSDITFEGGSIWKQNSDTSSESTPVDSSTFNPRMHSSDSERMRDLPMDSTPDTAISSKLDMNQSLEDILTPKSGEESHHKGSEKEKGNKWSEEEGKMIIGTDVFNAVLPSADELGLQWRISELRVALRASESARLESERETEALRNYLSEVEAAAAGLQSRVHELEHLISFSSKDETRELDQLRAKLATEASKESRSQAVAAARSVAAAREATMELDRVKAVLGGEKQHLLTELAMLRRGNQTLQGEVAEWQKRM